MQQAIDQLEEHIKGLGRNNPSLLSRHSSHTDKAASVYHSSVNNSQTTNTNNRSLRRSTYTSSARAIPKTSAHDENLDPAESVYLSCADYFRKLLQQFYLTRRNSDLPAHEKKEFELLETKILFTAFETLNKHVSFRFDCRI